MKVRWTADSVRYRITPSELETIQQGGEVRQEFRPGAVAIWSAVILASEKDTALTWNGNEIGILLSRPDRDRLAVPDVEGVYFRHEGDQPVRYFIEKDFPCIHPSASAAAETPTETFAPPSDFDQRKAT